MNFASEIAGVDVEAIAEFGEDLTYTPQGGAAVSLKGVFDEAFHLSQTLGENGAIQSASPGCVLNLADIAVGIDGMGTEGDTLTRGATTYYVTGIEPSGGLVVLRLSLNDPT